VPESYLREYRRRTALDWIVFAARIVAIGAFVGLAVILFLRLVRETGFRWRRYVGPLLVAFAGIVLALANLIPTVTRTYPTEQPFALFQLAAAIALSIGGIALLAVAGVSFVLLSGARPGWRHALRRGGSLTDAFIRAGIGAAGMVGLARWVAVASSRFPDLFDPDPTLPSALERALPGYAGFWSAATSTFTLGVAAAAVALAARQPAFRKPLWRVLGAAAVIVALVPTGARSVGEFTASFLPDVLLAAWVAFCAFGLLRDHAAGWAIFGALAFGGMRAAELLAQPAPPDRFAGWTVAVLCVLAATALLAGRREEARTVPSPLAEPEPWSSRVDGP
jgi:hypothetical protein